jgi:hypothetical protein
MDKHEYYVDEDGQKWLGPPTWLIKYGHRPDTAPCLFSVTTEQAAIEIVEVLNRHLSVFDPDWLYREPFVYKLHKGIKIVPDKDLLLFPPGTDRFRG